MKLVRHPVAQYLAVGAVVLTVIALGTSWLGGRAATAQSRAEARRTTELLGRSVVQPVLPKGLVKGDPAAIDQLDRTVLRRILVGDVRRIKIWAADGTVLYSDQTDLIGDTFDLGGDERAVLAGGPTQAEISDLARAENRDEQGTEQLLEVYTRIDSPEGDPLLFEAYYSLADVNARRHALLRAFRPITLGGLLVFLAVTTPLIWLLTRRLEATAAERERLLQAAASASEAERRRIARDLHDGVVQDLAATAFSLSAAARESGTSSGLRRNLEGLGASLRESLRALRSLLVEIHPPELQASGLGAALSDLVAPAAAAGVSAQVVVEDAETMQPETVSLIWRVAQEAVRNSLRHARATSLSVRVCPTSAPARGHVLEVTDDGRGFDPAADPGPGHFGLRGLASLARDRGGNLSVHSEPGRGTTVRLEVTAR